MKNRKILEYIAIILIFNLIVVAYYYNKPKTNSSERKRYEEKKTKNDCEPILNNQHQFYVNIDGQIYPKLVPSFFNVSINFECLNSKGKIKKILLWNDFGPWQDFAYGLGKVKPFVNRKCPVYNCEMTRNRSELADSDLVIIHMRGDFSHLPSRLERTNKSPRWVFFMAESPIYSKMFPSHLNGLFNLTATYKFDSDFLPYYYANLGFKWELNETFDENFDYLFTKTKLAVILVSHCKTHSERLHYVNEMQKHASGIDIYGQCGLDCGIKDENRYLSKQCRERLSRDYKFFLAFENSFCDDYVTEKLFDSILFDSVPVVFGLGNYEKWLPKSAYINALDFPSPQHLTEYLLNVGSNSTAYNSYFKWKKYIRLTGNEFKNFCDMCIKLQLEDFLGVKQSVVENPNWDYKSNCKQPLFSQEGFNLVPINYTHK